MMGRPTIYSDELAVEICDHLRDGGSLRAWVFGSKERPTFSTIYRWLDSKEEFREAYARARETQAHNDADRMNELGEELAQGSVAPDVARVMADILKWTAARRAPKSYGDKVQLSGSDDGAPIVVTWAKPQD